MNIFHINQIIENSKKGERIIFIKNKKDLPNIIHISVIQVIMFIMKAKEIQKKQAKKGKN